IANPMASILSAAMLLRLSLGLNDEAQTIETAVDSILSEGYRTSDIATGGERPLTTSQVGDMIAGLVAG
ncbi:MAG: 3-isopropylmalate dehydrogenase, partial [Chloroflexi bacterium]|nr:3-isopropylmalate dehydrogenase [Chloroflexota bacterium]